MALTSVSQDREIEKRIAACVAEAIKDGISELLEDILDGDQICNIVAEEAGIKGLFHNDDVKQYISDEFLPEDLFSIEDLEQWAITNGWRMDEDD